MSQDKPREFFGYFEGQTYSGGSKVYCLTEGSPDQEFIEHPGQFSDPIHVIDKRAFDRVVETHEKLYALIEKWCQAGNVDNTDQFWDEVEKFEETQTLKGVGVDV